MVNRFLMTVLVSLNASWIEKTKEHCLGFKVEESKFGDGYPPLSPTRTALVTVNTSLLLQVVVSIVNGPVN